MAIATSYTTTSGVVVPEACTEIMPPAYKRGSGAAIGIILCHGAGFTGPHVPVTSRVQAMAEGGWPCVGCDLGGANTFGNDTALARVADAKTYLQSVVGAKSGKVFLFGGSMGTAVALRYAMANPGNVQAIGAELPLVDLQDVYDNNRGGYQSLISTAYGARPSDAQNPAKNPSSFAGIPIKLWYSTDDTIVIPSTVTSFASAVGSNVTTQSIGAHGHDASTVDPAQVHAFFLANA